MPRTPKVPQYSLHKASGQAVVKVTIDGSRRTIYLGKHGSDESRERYARIVADLFAGRTITPPTVEKQGADTPEPSITFGQLVAQYQEHARGYYRKGDKPTTEVDSIRCALRYLLDAYLELPAEHFAVGDLRAVRQRMVDADLSRGVVNQNAGRIVRMFRWAASIEIAPACVWAGLQTLRGLKAGRTTARETKPVEPVDDETVRR